MRLINFFTTVFALLLSVSCFSQKVGAPRAKSQTATSYFADTMMSSGVWTWFSDPRAIYIPETSEVVVGAIQKTGTTTGQRRVASYKRGAGITLGPSGWNEGSDEDDHNLAVVVRLPTDTFFVAYSDHVGAPGLVYYRISSDTTISTFGSAGTAGTGATYAQLAILGDTLVHMWRDAAGGVAYWVMRKSTDGGRTWTAKDCFFSQPNDAAYLISRQTSGTRIDYICTNAHPTNPVTNRNCSVYHFYYERDSFFVADGTFLTKDTVTATALAAQSSAVLFNADTSDRNGWIWDVRASRFDGAQYPVVVYNTVDSLSPANNHQYHWAKWNGSAWEQSIVCDAGGTIADITGGYPTTETSYSGGITILQDNVLFCSRKVSGNFEIWKYRSNDEGVTWEGIKVVNGNGTNNKQGRPFVPVDYTPESPINCVWWSGTYDYFDLPYWDTVVKYGKF